jgi:ABC-2 type transport system permease protein
MSPEVPVIRIVFARELRVNLRTFAAWSLPLAGMLALVCALQPSLANGPLAAKLESLPDAMRRALGLEMFDFARPAAYLATNFTTVSIGLSLFAALLGASIIAKEETMRTAELLYAQPVSRTRILLGKAAAVATYAIAAPVLLGLVASALLAAIAARPLEPGLIGSLFAGVTVLAIFFAGAGMLVATLVRDARSANGVALGAVLGTFAIGIVSALSSTAAPLRWLSPFKWNEPSSIIAHGLDPATVALSLGLGMASAGIAIARYQRRDVRA